MIRTLLVLVIAALAVGCDSPEQSNGAAASQRKTVDDKSRALDFRDYPAAVFAGPLRFPKEDEWPDPNWREDSAKRINFGGHFTHIIINCGIACTSDWIVDRRDGRMIRTPNGESDVEPVSIETRPNSNLMKIIWVSAKNDGSGDIFPPCFRQNFAWTGTAFHPLSKRAEIDCPREVTQ